MLGSIWALAALATSALLGARAACECGYRDPTTSDLWTDALITYFNETSAEDQIVFQPAQSADRYGRDDPGYAGTGQQVWINSNRINEWEDDFSATWRSAVIPNNTHLGSNSSGLLMDVTPADTRNRISWGSQLQTRRRDMLYGSFRTMLNPPPGRYMAGTDFDVEVAWNQSELIRTAFFNTNYPGQGNVQVSYSSNDKSPEPGLYNQSTMNEHGGGLNGLEYRMDWLPTSVSFLNSGSNTTSNSKVWSGKDVGSPSVGAPFSYKHWSNGSPTWSQGPPVRNTITAQIIYARLFFNSSRPERQSEFDSACISAPSDAAVCSTDNLQLRDVTPFDLAATAKQTLPKSSHNIPVYSIYGFTISGGLFAILTLHATVRRMMSSRSKKANFYEKYYRDQQDQLSFQDHSPSSPPTTLYSTTPAETLDDHVDHRLFNEAMTQWEDPAKLLAEDDDDDLETIDSDNEDDEAIKESWGFIDHDGSSLYSGNTNASGYVLPHIQLDRNDTRNTGVLTPINPADYSKSSGSPEDRSHTPVSMFRANSNPSIPGHGVYGSMTATTSAASFPVDDGLGHPPSLPHVAPTVLLEDGSQAPVAWITPIVDWSPAGGSQSKAHGQLAAPPAEVVAQDQQDFSQFEPQSLWQRLKSRFFVSRGGGQATSSGAARVEYLDGLRGFACFLVSLHHFLLIYYYGMASQPTNTGKHYHFEFYMYKILGPIIANGGLNVGIFFVLSARVICNRFLFRGNLQHLAQTILTRVPRLGVTVSAALITTYFLIQVQAFYWVPMLPSRTFSTWSYYEDWTNAGTFFNAWLSLWWMQSPSSTPFITHYSTGIIWSMLPMIQNSWTCALCALIAREIKNPKKRYPFYSACILLSWWSNRFDYFFLGGLMLADLDVRFQYRQKLGLAGAFLAWGILIVSATITWLHFGKVINKENEWDIHPDFVIGGPNRWAGTQQAWYLPMATDFALVISFFLLNDLCTPVRSFFQLRFWNVFGRNAFSLYLIHGMVFWSVGAVACLKMLAAGIPYWAVILINFFLCYALLFVVCELFTRTFDRWGVTLARSFWRSVTGGLGRRSV